MKHNNLIRSVVLTTLLVIFCATPQQIFSADIDYQVISTWESKKIIKSMPKELYNNWAIRKGAGENNLNVTTIALLKEILRKDARDYMFHELPVDISINVIAETIDISRIIISGDMATVINKIEKDSVNFAVSYLNDYFNKGKANAGYGAIDVNYTTPFGNTNTIIQYIILSKEIDSNRSEVVARIYSPKTIIPPESYKGYGMIEGFLNELSPGDSIPPFIVEIRGTIRKSSLGEYGWNKSPQIDLVFPDNVPDFGLRPPSLVEKYIIKPIQEKIKELGSIFGFLGGNTEFVEVVTGGREDKGAIESELVSMDEEKSVVPVSCSRNNLGNPLHNIIINEVAWMGTHNSSSDEWIELKNVSGRDINMKGWSLVDKTNQIDITFDNLIIKSGDFVLLERTDDGTIPSINADLIYKGTLGNANEELYLFNNNCGLEDYIAASPSWPAGNSSQRRTMERKDNLDWQTYAWDSYYNILGTPKRENSIVKEEEKVEPKTVEVKEEPKEEIKEEVKEEPKEEIKEETKEQPEEETKEEEVVINYCLQVGTPSHSGIVINEVAWMGTTAGATKEWIELKNISTKPINMKGWQLLDKDNQIKVIFDEYDILAPGQIYLLERTSDDSVPNISADKIYTGILSNSNESLRLFNSSCQLIDEVLASSSWPAGSSSERKTIERNSDLTWHTSFNVNGSPKTENSQPALISNSNNNQNTTTIIYASSPAPEETISYCPQVGIPSHSGIIINEIAWMGTTVGATKEWVELKNVSDEEISLSGWQLLSKDNRIRIIFDDDESLGPNQFYLLERTSDNSVPDISADKIYTGAIGNSDDLLMLFNNQCQLIDEVVADPDWIAGNSSERKTMERDNDLNWHTSSAINGTPKEENSTPEEIEEVEEDDPSQEEDVVVENNDYLVISEIQVNGEDNLEYVELYNQSEEEINFCDDEENCFYLSYFAPTFNLDETPKYNWNNPYYNWKLEGSISPGEYYLVVIHGNIDGDMVVITEDDVPYSSAIINNSMGSFALFSSNPIIEDEELTEEDRVEQAKLLKIDAVGWGDNDLPVKENEVTNSGEGSMTRKWLTEKYIDGDNNLNDFSLQKSSPGEYTKQPPEKIENIEMESIRNTITLSWETPYDPDSSSEDISYEVYLSMNGADFNILEDADIINEESRNTFALENLYYDKDYYFKIKAIDLDENESEISDEVICKTQTSNHIKPLLYGNYQKNNSFNIPYLSGEIAPELLNTIIEEDNYKTNFVSNPLIGDGEVVYLSITMQGSKRIVAIKDDEIFWNYRCDRSCPLLFLGKDGTIYFHDNRNIMALSPDGKLKWKEEFNYIHSDSFAIDSQERIYFITDDYNIIALEDNFDEVNAQIVYSFDNYLGSAPIAIDSSDNIYFSNKNTLIKASFSAGKISEKIIEVDYHEDYEGDRDKEAIISKIDILSDNRILINVRDQYYDENNRSHRLTIMLSSNMNDILWQQLDYSPALAIGDNQFYIWQNKSPSDSAWMTFYLYGIDLSNGEIQWGKKWSSTISISHIQYLIADKNNNIYFIQGSKFKGYNVENITSEDPVDNLIIDFSLADTANYFSIGEEKIYFTFYKKVKSFQY